MGSKENKVVERDDYYIIHVDGAPLHLHRKSNEDRRECGPETCTLVTKDDYRYGHSEEFRIPTVAGVKHFLLRGNTEWYNSCEERPVWPRGMNREQMTVISVFVTTESEPFPVDVPEVVEISDIAKKFCTRDLPDAILRKLGLAEVAAEKGRLVAAHVERDSNDASPTQEEMLAHLSGKLINHGFCYRELVKICPIEGMDDYYVVMCDAAYQA